MHVLLHSVPPTLKQATTDPRLHWKLWDTHRQVRDSLLWGHCSLLLGPGAHKVLLFPPRVYFPVLCKVCQLYGGVNGDLLQEGLCHSHVCCTLSPSSCGSPLLPRTSTGDTRTQFCFSLCGVPGSWCAQALFEPSEHLWQEWGLILNVNLPLLPSCWGFSFTLRCEVSPHSFSSAYYLTGVSLTLDLGYLLTVHPAKSRHCTWPGTWGISSWLLASCKDELNKGLKRCGPNRSRRY